MPFKDDSFPRLATPGVLCWAAFLAVLALGVVLSLPVGRVPWVELVLNTYDGNLRVRLASLLVAGYPLVALILGLGWAHSVSSQARGLFEHRQLGHFRARFSDGLFVAVAAALQTAGYAFVTLFPGVWTVLLAAVANAPLAWAFCVVVLSVQRNRGAGEVLSLMLMAFLFAVSWRTVTLTPLFDLALSDQVSILDIACLGSVSLWAAMQAAQYLRDMRAARVLPYLT